MYFIEVVGWLIGILGVFLLVISIIDKEDRHLRLPTLAIAGIVLSLFILLYAVPAQRKLDDRINNMIEQVERIERGG